MPVELSENSLQNLLYTPFWDVVSVHPGVKLAEPMRVSRLKSFNILTSFSPSHSHTNLLLVHAHA